MLKYFILFITVVTTTFAQTNYSLLAIVGDRKIYLNEFYQRAEYTIRPGYCKGNTNIDKMIILNSLIAEKLFALEAEKNNEFESTPSFERYIRGRKEMAMRQLLFKRIAYDKVKLDSSEVRLHYKLAGRKYRIKYINVDNKEIADSAAVLFRKSPKPFEDTFVNLSGYEEIPEREIDYFQPEDKFIHDSLFSKLLKKDQIVGPVSIDDITNLIIKIDGWTESVLLSEQQRKTRYNDVIERLKDVKSDLIYKRFMSEVMQGKTLQFNKDVFNALVKFLAPLYMKSAKEKKEYFTRGIFGKSVNEDSIDVDYSLIENILDKPLMKIDNEIWTVRQLEEYLDVHPFVFRKKKFNPDEFPAQLKYAIADLLRDKYITGKAYQMGLDKAPEVEHYASFFRDAEVARFFKYKFIETIKEKNSNKILDALNTKVKELQRKYSGEIKINVDLFNRIKLTRVDMFVTNRNAPFPIAVPAFPQLTTEHHLDYGKKME